MPRQARIGLPAQIHHVIIRGNNRSWIFEDREDFEKYLKILNRYKAKSGFLLYHWVLMNNHFLCGAPHKKCYVKRQLM